MRKISLPILAIIASVYVFGFCALLFFLSVISDNVSVDTLLIQNVQVGILMILGVGIGLAILIVGFIYRKAQTKAAPFIFALCALTLLMGVGLIPATLILAGMGVVHLSAKGSDVG